MGDGPDGGERLPEVGRGWHYKRVRATNAFDVRIRRRACTRVHIYVYARARVHTHTHTHTHTQRETGREGGEVTTAKTSLFGTRL